LDKGCGKLAAIVAKIETAIAILDDVLTRMEAHQLKKTPQLRALHSW
jgi:hypothetical protein